MITPRDAIGAAKAFQHALKGEVVTTDEIRRRGAICNSCPRKELVRNRASQASQLLGLLANRHRVPREIKSYSCGVCGCSLMLLLPATAKDLHKDTPEQKAERPESCWILTASQKTA